MEEKKVTKIRLSTAILGFIIMILIFALAITYYFGFVKEDKSANNIQNSSDNKSDTQIVENTVQSKENVTTEMSTSSNLIQKLYGYIPAIDVNSPEPANAYQNKKVTMADIDEKYLLAYGFTKLSLSESDKLPYLNEDGTTEGPYDGWFSFKAELLQEKVKELYGKNIDNQYFDYGIAQGCGYKNGMYTHSAGGSLSDIIFNVRKIQKAYEESETIYIEDKYMTLRQEDDTDTGTTSYKLYKSSNCTNFIENLDSNIVQKLNNNSTQNYLEEIANKYENKMISYRHTFKKNAEGSYYWYSTEPLETITDNKEENKTSYTIEGSYEYKEALENIAYVFKDGKVTLETNATTMGTYEIIGNKIKIHFNQTIDPAEDNPKDINRDEELKILDDNTLINEQYNAKYYKTK